MRRRLTILLIPLLLPMPACEHLGQMSASYTHDVSGMPVTVGVQDGGWYVSGKFPGRKPEVQK